MCPPRGGADAVPHRNTACSAHSNGIARTYFDTCPYAHFRTKARRESNGYTGTCFLAHAYPYSYPDSHAYLYPYPDSDTHAQPYPYAGPGGQACTDAYPYH